MLLMRMKNEDVADNDDYNFSDDNCNMNSDNMITTKSKHTQSMITLTRTAVT